MSRTSDGRPVRIFHRVFGKPGASPMLIVHGLSFFSYDWIGPASRLATDRQVAAIDMRGFGDSDWPGEYSLAAHAADIVAVLDHLGWERAILIGHSMGGRHAAVAAAHYPKRFEALILFDYTPQNAAEGSARVAKRTASTPALMLKRDPHFRDQFRHQVETGEKHKLELDLWQVLASIQCPTLIIRGARSDMFTVASVPRILASKQSTLYARRRRRRP